MNKIKFFTIILLIFVLGGLTGALGTRWYVKHRMTQFVKGGPMPVDRFLMKRLTGKLDLTESQQDELEKITGQMQTELYEFRKSHHPKLEAIFNRNFEQMKEKLRLVLTEEQMKEYELFRDERPPL